MSREYIRGGQHALRPYLYVRPDMIDFVQNVFDAEIIARYDTPIGTHVEAAIDDSILILEAAEHFPENIDPTVASVYLYVADVDATYSRAMECGATSISAPEAKPYDERQCGISDTFGNTWWISAYLDPAANP